jgi:uncharacterized lipoprotein YddW (UPF0748 family)
VDTLIVQMSKAIKEEKRHVKFAVSPFGLYRLGEPENTKGLDQVKDIYSDPKVWLSKGWVDYLALQLYWKESSNRSYSKLLTWWGENNRLRRHIYAANALMSLERKNGGWPLSELVSQVKGSRASDDLQSIGNVFFGCRVLHSKKRAEVRSRFAKDLYSQVALPPVMP